MKRSVTVIVVHCTATRMDVDFTQKDLLRCHRARGMTCVGYHFYIRKDGYIWSTRPLEQVGAHARGHNQDSIGIAYEGGLDEQGLPADTRTQQQKFSMRALIRTLKKLFHYPSLRTSGLESGQEWQWGSGTVGMAQTMSVLRCSDG